MTPRPWDAKRHSIAVNWVSSPLVVYEVLRTGRVTQPFAERSGAPHGAATEVFRGKVRLLKPCNPEPGIDQDVRRQDCASRAREKGSDASFLRDKIGGVGWAMSGRSISCRTVPWTAGRPPTDRHRPDAQHVPDYGEPTSARTMSINCRGPKSVSRLPLMKNVGVCRTPTIARSLLS